MILPVLKYCLPIYLLLAGTFLVFGKGVHLSLAAVLILLALIVAIMVLGLFLGMILSVVIRRPRYERTFYWIGQGMAFVLIVTPIVRVWFNN